jgi:hypothetical protein
MTVLRKIMTADAQKAEMEHFNNLALRESGIPELRKTAPAGIKEKHSVTREK